MLDFTPDDRILSRIILNRNLNDETSRVRYAQQPERVTRATAFDEIDEIERLRKENESLQDQLNTARATWHYMWQVLVIENPAGGWLPFGRVREMLWSLKQTLGELE